jgi:hypothetical protein
MQVHRDDLVEFRLVVFLDRAEPALDAGVVEKGIDAAEPGQAALDIRRNVRAPAHVGDAGLDPHAERLDDAAPLLERRRVDVDEQDIGARPGQRHRRRVPDHARAAGDDGDAVFHRCGHLSLPRGATAPRNGIVNRNIRSFQLINLSAARTSCGDNLAVTGMVPNTLPLMMSSPPLRSIRFTVMSSALSLEYSFKASLPGARSRSTNRRT